MTGASGTPYGIRLVEILSQDPNIETHVIISDNAARVGQIECGQNIASILPVNVLLHDNKDIGSGPASGSWPHHGMAICPCSMATLAGIAQGRSDNLILRAADVTLKERRPLVLVPRETPFSRIHLRNMLELHDAGAVILPPCPAFYLQPKTIADMIDQIVARILDHINIRHDVSRRWEGGGS